MTAPATPAKKRIKKRLLIPSLLLIVGVIGLAVLIVRGTWADSAIKDPASVEAGSITQLYRTPDGHTQVRCAIVIPARTDVVWSAIIDFDKHPKFLPYIKELSAERGPDDVTRLKGSAHSRMWGDWPFDCKVKEAKTGDVYSATWDEAGDPLKVNRGGWHAKAVSGGTLVWFTLELEANGYPNFLLRNILMDRMHAVLKGLGEEAAKRSAADNRQQEKTLW